MKSNKLRIASFLLPLLILGFSFVNVAFAQNSTGGGGTTAPCIEGSIVPCCEGSGCNFDELIKAVKRVVNWGVTLALMLTVVVIAYAGFLYLTSADNANKRSQANKMFVRVLQGMFFILGAWLIVTLIMSALAKSDIPIFLK